MKIKQSKSHKIIITPGEPSGIGPDIIIQLSQEFHFSNLVICSSPSLLINRAKQLNLPIHLHIYSNRLFHKSFTCKKRELVILPIETKEPVIAGKINVLNSDFVISTLKKACDSCLKKEFAALITGPVNKSIINHSGYHFTGHTEFLSKRTKSYNTIMTFVSSSLRVALLTTHIPLQKVFNHINEKKIRNAIKIITLELRKKFFIYNPCIYICGLNPHAGENGYIGKEEKDIIIPILNSLRKEGYNLVGPLPADTLLQKKYLEKSDVILSMFHDQILPALKYKHFGKLINITFGLPFIRTSVDHGTALDIAGTGLANTSSMKYCIEYTRNILKNYEKNLLSLQRNK